MIPENVGQFKKDRDKARTQIRVLIAKLVAKHDTQIWETAHAILDTVIRDIDINTSNSVKMLDSGLAETWLPATLEQIKSTAEPAESELEPASPPTSPGVKKFEQAVQAEIEAAMKAAKVADYAAMYGVTSPPVPIDPVKVPAVYVTGIGPSDIVSTTFTVGHKLFKATVDKFQIVLDPAFKFVDISPTQYQIVALPETLDVWLPYVGAVKGLKLTLYPNNPYYLAVQMLHKLGITVKKLVEILVYQGFYDVDVLSVYSSDFVSLTWKPAKDTF